MWINVEKIEEELIDLLFVYGDGATMSFRGWTEVSFDQFFNILQVHYNSNKNLTSFSDGEIEHILDHGERVGLLNFAKNMPIESPKIDRNECKRVLARLYN